MLAFIRQDADGTSTGDALGSEEALTLRLLKSFETFLRKQPLI